MEVTNLPYQTSKKKQEDFILQKNALASDLKASIASKKLPPSYIKTLVNEEIYFPQLLRISIWNYVNTCNLLTLAYKVGSKGKFECFEKVKKIYPLSQWKRTQNQVQPGVRCRMLVVVSVYHLLLYKVN